MIAQAKLHWLSHFVNDVMLCKHSVYCVMSASVYYDRGNPSSLISGSAKAVC